MEGKRRAKLNVYEERILRIMRDYYEWKSINEIAEESGIHWKTVKHHLSSLGRKKLVTSRKERVEGGVTRRKWRAVQKRMEDEDLF